MSMLICTGGKKHPLGMKAFHAFPLDLTRHVGEARTCMDSVSLTVEGEFAWYSKDLWILDIDNGPAIKMTHIDNEARSIAGMSRRLSVSRGQH